MPRKTQIREHVKRLTLFDDVLFQKASEDKGFCEEILRVFLEDPELAVLENTPQKKYVNLQGRSAAVDLVCQLKGRTVNVEVQKTDDVDHLRRIRYHSSLITTNITDPGAMFEAVPDVIVVYVTTFDIFGKGDARYVAHTTLRNYGDVIDDGLKRIYVNAAIDDGSKLSRLMRVFKGDRTFIEDFPRTRDRIVKFTEQEEGVQEMSNIVEEIFSEDLKKAINEAKKEGQEETLLSLKKMLQNNCTLDDIRNAVDRGLQKSPA